MKAFWKFQITLPDFTSPSFFGQNAPPILKKCMGEATLDPYISKRRRRRSTKLSRHLPCIYESILEISNDPARFHITFLFWPKRSPHTKKMYGRSDFGPLYLQT